MFRFLFNSMRTRKQLAVLVLLALGLALPFSAGADKKKKGRHTRCAAGGPRKFPFDPNKLVWPSPPNIARIHWLDYFAGTKIDYTPAANCQAQSKLDGPACGRPIRRLRNSTPRLFLSS